MHIENIHTAQSPQTGKKLFPLWSTRLSYIWVDADKSLARPGRNKLQRPNSGFIQHTPHEAQYTVYLVALTFASHSKKFRMLSVQPGFRDSSELRVGRKMATFQLFFQSREQVVVRRGQIRRIGCVIKTLEAQVVQFLLGCKCPVSRSIVVQEQDPLFNVFPSKCPPIAPAEMSNIPRWYFGPLEDNQRWGSQKIEARTFPADFCTRNFWGRG